MYCELNLKLLMHFFMTIYRYYFSPISVLNMKFLLTLIFTSTLFVDTPWSQMMDHLWKKLKTLHAGKIQ